MNTDPFVKRSTFDPGIHITLHDDGVTDIYDSAQGSYLSHCHIEKTDETRM